MKQYPGLYFSTLGIDDHYPNGESPVNKLITYSI